jgi:ABC-type sugar transport system substrate-binding protein
VSQSRPTYPRHISQRKMFNSRVKIAFFLILLACLLSACAQVKEAGRTIGHTTRDAARAIGHGTRDAAKAVGEGVKKVVKSAPDDEW